MTHSRLYSKLDALIEESLAVSISLNAQIPFQQRPLYSVPSVFPQTLYLEMPCLSWLVLFSAQVNLT